MRRLYVLLITLALATAGCLGGDEPEADDGDGSDNGTGNETGNETRDPPGAGNETGNETGSDGGAGTPGAGNETGNESSGGDAPAKPDPSEAFVDESFPGSGETTFTVPVEYARLRVGVQDDAPTTTPFTVTLTSPDGEEVVLEGGSAGLNQASDASCHWSNVEPGAAGEWALAIEAENPTETLRVLVYGSDAIDAPTGDTDGACAVPSGESEDAEEG